MNLRRVKNRIYEVIMADEKDKISYTGNGWGGGR